MKVTISLTNNFLDGYQQSTETAIENLALISSEAIARLAPFANPAQYDYNYYNHITGWETGGSLVASIHAVEDGLQSTVESRMPYAIRRNYENNLNPQTLHYIERGVDNALRGVRVRWWRFEE